MSTKLIRLEDARRVIRLLYDARSTTDPADQGRILVDGLCGLIGADAGFFVEIIKQQHIWTPATFGTGSERDPKLLEFMQQWGSAYPIDFDLNR